MKTTIKLLTYFLVLHLVNVNAQSFVESECGIVPNSSYSYYNYQNDNYGYGFKLYHNSDLLMHYESDDPGKGYQVVFLKFINATTGYFAYSSRYSIGISYTVNKIIGDTIKYFTGCSNAIEFYIVNANIAYLSTYEGDWVLYKCSDELPEKQLIECTPKSDTTIIDTILGMPLCPNLSAINIHYYTDTINCKILFHIIDSSYSIHENKFDQWKVYPCPANDYIYLETSDPTNSCVIKIFNSVGILQRSIILNKLFKQTIYVGDLRKGVYFIEINQGRTKYFNKMVKM